MDKTSNLGKKQRMKSSIIAGVLSCSLLSGCGIKTASDNEIFELSKSNNEYSTVFAFIANNLGIDCLVLIGERHAFNIVTIDDNRYFIDCLDKSITKIDIIDMYDKIINLPEYVTDLEEHDFKEIKLIMAFLGVTEILALIDIAHKRKKYDYLFEDEGIKEYVRRK